MKIIESTGPDNTYSFVKKIDTVTISLTSREYIAIVAQLGASNAQQRQELIDDHYNYKYEDIKIQDHINLYKDFVDYVYKIQTRTE